MALILGTNCGFVTSAPLSDPDGTNGSSLSNLVVAVKHSLAAGHYTVTEIGFWQDLTTNSQCNFNVGIYSHNSGSDAPATLIATQSSGLYVAANTAGWAKYSGLSIDINIADTTYYWIACGFQNVTTECKINYGILSGTSLGEDTITGPTLETDWSGSQTANYAFSIYAVYEEAASGLSIPVAQSIYRRRR